MSIREQIEAWADETLKDASIPSLFLNPPPPLPASPLEPAPAPPVSETAPRRNHGNLKGITMINPTVGRVVLFHPSRHFSGCSAGDGVPLPAMIARVWSDTCINIGGFDANGVPFSATSVLLIQDSNPVPDGGHYCEWMPYQKGQAAKTEALQEALAAKPV